MGIRIPTIRAEGYQWVEPIEALEMSQDRNRIVLHCHDQSSENKASISISIVSDPVADTVMYSTADGHTFESVLEVINYIGEKIAACARLV